MTERQRPGTVRDAIVRYLREARGGAGIEEIRAAAESELGAPVAASSIRSYLGLNTPQMFVRTARGRYALAEPCELPLPPAPVQRAFTHGRCEMFGADCLDWLANRPPNSIHGVVTDPPYGLVEYSPKQQEKLRNGRGGVWRIPPAFDGSQRSPLPRFTTLDARDLEAIHRFFARWARALLPALVQGAHVIVASNPLVSFLVAGAIVEAGLERRGEIIRLVMTMRGGDKPKNAHEEFPGVSVMPRSMWEPWLLFRKPIEGRVQDNLRKWKTGGLRRISEARPFGDVIESHPTRPAEREIAPHPSLKPQAFLRQVVRAVLPLGEGVVVDPFAGSGSTLAAAEALGYQSIGVESDRSYVALAREAIPRLAMLHVAADRPSRKD